MKGVKSLAIRGLDWGTNVALVLLLAGVFALLAAPHVLGWKYGMSPELPAGAAIVVAPAGVGDIAPGDVITYRSAANAALLVTHRVEAITTDERGRTAFITKGDANENVDGSLVTGDRLLGKVIYSVPDVGHLVEKLQTRIGFIVLLVLPTLLIVALELRELVAGVREMIDKRRSRGPRGPAGGSRGDGQPDLPLSPVGGSSVVSHIVQAPPAATLNVPLKLQEQHGAGIFTLPLMTFSSGTVFGRSPVLGALLFGLVVLLALQLRHDATKRKVGV
jgi:signal peptidase I